MLVRLHDFPDIRVNKHYFCEDAQFFELQRPFDPNIILITVSVTAGNGFEGRYFYGNK